MVEGIAELQAVGKHADIETSADFGKGFARKMMNKYQHYVVHIVFDTYIAESNQEYHEVTEVLGRLHQNIK